jgi:hypothetical protein
MKKVLTVLMAAALLFALVPASALAADLVPMEITADLPTFSPGTPALFTVRTIPHDDAGTFVLARFTLPEGVTVEYQELGDPTWRTLTDYFGPAVTGFPLDEITTTFRGTFAQPGSYRVKVEFVTTGYGEKTDQESGVVIGSRYITVTVIGDPEAHTVSYHPNGGLGTVPMDMNRYYRGDKVTLLSGAGLTKGGQVWKGWELRDGTDVTSPMTMPGGDVTLFAVYGPLELEVPKTGDNASAFGFVLLFAGLAAAAFVLIKKRAAAK